MHGFICTSADVVIVLIECLIHHCDHLISYHNVLNEGTHFIGEEVELEVHVHGIH